MGFPVSWRHKEGDYMLERWQFNVLFWIGAGGAVVMLFAPAIGLDSIGKNPVAATGVGAILTFILTQKKTLTKHDDQSTTPEGGG